jgi:hypothetical protein
VEFSRRAAPVSTRVEPPPQRPREPLAARGRLRIAWLKAPSKKISDSSPRSSTDGANGCTSTSSCASSASSAAHAVGTTGMPAAAKSRR